MRVLVVDDDRALGGFLQKCLAREGHQVEWVGDGEAALVTAESLNPDLIVLDLSLPRLDGLEVLEELRSKAFDCSVLVLTGRNQRDERVHCLNLGADDCLLKPFSFSELMARARALLRRREQFSDPVLRHGDLELNRLERRVTLAGSPIDLTGKEYALLEYLFVRRGQCVSRNEILEQVWNMPGSANTNVVDVYVNYVRRKLAAAGSGQPPRDMIETVRGTGYRIGSSATRLPLRTVPPTEMVRAI